MIESMEMSEFGEIKPKLTFVKRFFRYFCVLCMLFLGTIAALLLIAVFRAISIKPVFKVDDVVDGNFTFSQDRLQYMTSLFAESLRFKTVSRAPHDYNRNELQKLQEFLKQKFGLLFNTSFIKWETVNNYSLLFTIQGSEATLSPYLLASHMDVVPVQEDQWTHDPFLGKIIHDPETGDEVVWGRGAIDDKSGVMGILSAMEILLESGWIPRRSFFIAFGHDEEVHGYDGAGHIARLLKDRKIRLDFIIDEGMPITIGVCPGMADPVAVIGVTEKGWMNVKLTAVGMGGHSSMPPKDQAVDRLSKAISNLYDNSQPSMYGSGTEKDMIRYLAHKASWPHKLFYANQWLFGSVLNFIYSQSSKGRNLIRTSTAVTMYKGGVKINVIPTKATAVINHRVHPSQDLENVLFHDRRAISDDKVEVTMIDGQKPHPISPYGPTSPTFRLIASVIKHISPDTVTVPGLMIGNTDLRHYMNMTDVMYRLYPFILDRKGIEMIHAKNERISVSNFQQTIKFYVFCIKNADNYHVYEQLSTFVTEDEL